MIEDSNIVLMECETIFIHTQMFDFHFLSLASDAKCRKSKLDFFQS